MRRSLPAILLTGCAVLTLTAPAAAQDAPIVVDPPLSPPVGQPPIVVPLPGVDVIDPQDLLPPLIVPDEEAPTEPAVPAVVAIPEIWTPVPIDAAGQSAYGLYLSGRMASMRGEGAAGADLLAESQALVPEQPVVGEDAFKSGLLAGDLDALVRIAPAVQDTPVLAEVGRLAEVVEALRRGDARASLATLQARPFDEPYVAVTRFLFRPIAAAAGDWDAALAPVTLSAADPGALILLHQRAQLLEARRRFAEAEADYKTLVAIPVGAQEFGGDYVAFLMRRGRDAEASAFHQTVMAASAAPSSNGRAPELSRLRSPEPPTTVEMAADALRFGAIFLRARSAAIEFAAIFLRLSESLHPDDETALLLGQSLAALNRESSARESFARVGAENPARYAIAQLEMGVSYAGEDRMVDALAAFQRARAAAPRQPQILRVLAAQLIALGRSEEALEVLNDPWVNTAEQPPEFRELRGAALQNLGRLDEAENELWAALQAAPDDPGILNSLGYMWVDSGRRVDQGAEMLARAHAADPDSGNIQDSLGWAQFRQGQYDVAVETLEQAVAKLPGNAEIVDHLGDAYWQVGRRREAEWQWSRVLTLEPDAERRAEVEQKLARGLSAAPSVSASQP